MNYSETLTYLEGIGWFSVKHSEEHTVRMLALLGHPERRVPVIHVAGTNGKGSTSVFLASVLRESGRRTALFISPHLTRITERMSIDGEEISEEEFAAAADRVREASEEIMRQGESHPSWFEFLFLMAMVWFAEKDVDIAVIETGLGGRLDATNSLKKPLLTVITRIGLDHTQYLGDTIEKVAYEKAGIMKAGVPCAAMPGDPAAERVIREEAGKMGVPLTILHREDIRNVSMHDGVIDFSLSFRYDGRAEFSISSPAAYQAENGALALLALNLLRGEDDAFSDISAENAAAGLGGFHFPARLQNAEQDVWLDGANNPDGIRTLMESFSGIGEGRRKILLFAAMKDKDVPLMVRYLCEDTEWDGCVVTAADPKRGAETSYIKDLFAGMGVNAETEENPEAAYARAKELTRGGVLLVCGSLYLAGTILELLGGNT